MTKKNLHLEEMLKELELAINSSELTYSELEQLQNKLIKIISNLIKQRGV